MTDEEYKARMQEVMADGDRVARGGYDAARAYEPAMPAWDELTQQAKQRWRLVASGVLVAATQSLAERSRPS